MLGQHDALKLLEPYLPMIRNIITGGFSYYYERYADECHRHHPRSRATLVNDHIVDLAKQQLGRKSGVTQVNCMGRRLFEVDNKFVVHFKKLDRRKMASNYPTLFALDYNRQLELPGLPAALPRLVAGFVPSKDWTTIEGVYITCPDGDENAWFIDLTRRTDNIQRIETIEHERTEQQRKRVRIKGAPAPDERKRKVSGES